MKKVTEDYVRKLLREIAEQTLKEFDLQTKSDIDIVSTGLKVRHKKSKLLYTVSSVGLSDAVLDTPEGQPFVVTKKELEKDYEVA